jgi:hypothetical protein
MSNARQQRSEARARLREIFDTIEQHIDEGVIEDPEVVPAYRMLIQDGRLIVQHSDRSEGRIW